VNFNPSLNQAVLSGFEHFPPDIAGSRAHRWLATWGMAEQMSTRLALENAPHIPLALSKERLKVCQEYPPILDTLIREGNVEALALADRFGAALATLILTLKLASPDSQNARPDWSLEHWNRWRAVEQLTLGGGVFCGELGQHLYQSALSWLAVGAAPPIQIFLPPEPRMLSLRGLARYFNQGTVAVVDAGHTAIKRGIGFVDNGELERLDCNEPLPIPSHLNDAEEILNFLLETLTEQSKKAVSVNQFGVSLSVYLDADGNVSRTFGMGSFYSPLMCFDLVAELEKRLSQRLARACVVRVMHEGKAAVNAYAKTDAVILLGTSVGGGLLGV
jgi:hypothetical protein